MYTLKKQVALSWSVQKLQTAGGHTSLGVVAPEGSGGEFLKRESIVKALEAAEDVDVGDGSR
jgi:hypothetical protein